MSPFSKSIAVQRLHRKTSKLNNCFTNGLTRNRGSVNADASDHGCAVNYGDALVLLPPQRHPAVPQNRCR
jgi:hypothetical protein